SRAGTDLAGRRANVTIAALPSTLAPCNDQTTRNFSRPPDLGRRPGFAAGAGGRYLLHEQDTPDGRQEGDNHVWNRGLRRPSGGRADPAGRSAAARIPRL